MKFQVYYSAAGLPKSEFPLREHEIEHHISCLAGDLAARLGPKGVIPYVEVIEEKSGQHAVVTLDDGGKGLDLKTMLADCLRDINFKADGLCFVGEKIAE